MTFLPGALSGFGVAANATFLDTRFTFPTTAGRRVGSAGCSISDRLVANWSATASAIRIASSAEASVTVAVSSTDPGVVVTAMRSASSSGVVLRPSSVITSRVSRVLRSSSR